MTRNRNRRRGPMGKPVSMSDRFALIQELLQDTREAQERGNAILSNLRVDVAALQRSHDGQGQVIADMRAELRQLSDRQRESELRIQRMPKVEDLNNLEGRVRVLEGDGRETRVMARAVGGGLRDVWRYALAAIGGVIVTAVLWAVKHGGAPS